MPLILSDAHATVRLNRQTFPNEDDLQRYIYEHPEAIPLDEIDGESQICVLAREFPTKSGPVDVLATNRAGHALLIETKLFRNSDKRLVLAQVLDYAAALWEDGPTPDDILDACRTDAEKRLSPHPLKRLAGFLGQDEDAARQHFSAVAEAFAAGNITAIVLMDRLDERLKTLISFVNDKTWVNAPPGAQFRVLAVQLDYYVHDHLKIVNPHLFGAEARRTAGGRAPRGAWDEEVFFARLAQSCSPDVVAAARKLYEFGRARGEISWGTGRANPSFNPYFAPGSNVAPFTLGATGTLYLKLSWMKSPSEQPFVEATIRALSATGLPLEDAREGNPSWRPEVWTPRVDKLISAFNDALRILSGDHGSSPPPSNPIV